MKNLLVLCCVAALFSCQKEEILEDQPNAYPQTWQLVKLRSSWTNAVLTGANMPIQETYVFQKDSTFTKTRQRGETVQEAQGTFSVRENATGLSLQLAYPTKSTLVNNCSADPKEYFWFKADTLIGGSEACDGARLYYKKSQ